MARRHLLIGRGPAAVAAAETIRGLDDAAEITVVAVDPHGYYSRPGLAYFLAREVPEKGLFPFTQEALDRLRVRWIVGHVVRINPAEHSVTLQDGSALPYDRLLIATGSRAIPLSVPGAGLDGVVKLDDLDDARNLIQRRGKASSAVVVGGGITALEIVEGLRARRVHVHYFMRKDRYWGNVLSESESRLIEDGLRARGVQVHYFTELAEVLGKQGAVTGVVTGEGLRIPCDLVAVAIGVVPQIEIAEAAGLACARGILVDEYLRSSDPEIFAAGDVAEVYDTVNGRRSMEVLWNSAVTTGRLAGLNMATEPTHIYVKDTPLNVTRLAGFKITIIGTVGGGKDSDVQGLSRGDSDTWRESGSAIVVESPMPDGRVRLVLGPSRIEGAVVMGDQALSFPLQELIRARADTSSIFARLQQPGAPVDEIVREFWSEWKARVV